mmetsp:Transcript_3154/g.4852  ORF Transcript_3154/g.4852 Transcript_3154/m.4852 type:complete len:730 (+) Transcript_3154:89-2278(+)
MSKAAVASNTDVLESLPPAVPSIGWRKPQRLDEGGIDSNTQTATTTSSQPNTQLESSQTPATAAVADATGEPNNDEDAVKPTNIPSSIKIGNRTVITSKPPRQWAWKSFTSSARNDSANFFHWVRANIEYADYPYARFDVHLDPLTYTNEEYEKYLAMSAVEDLGDTLPDFLMVGNQIRKGGDGTETKVGNNSTEESSLFQQQLLQSNKILPWTKAETDVLMELCQNCDLRWPVIIDRWHMRFKKGTVGSLRKVEDLQYRYYQIGSILAQKRVVAEATKLSVASTPAGGADALPSKDPKDTVAADTTAAEGSSSQPTTSTAEQPLLDPAESAALESTLKLPSAAPSLSIPNSGISNRGKMFDLVAERERRKQLDYIWHQSKEEAQEEAALRAELRAVEAQLRKLKKAGKHLVPSGSALAAVPPPQPTKKANAASVKSSTASTKTSAASTTIAAAPASARSNTTVVAVPVDPFFYAHQEVDASFNETAPVPTPGTPYLQSGRLFPPNIEGHAKLKKTTLKQMDEILSELGVPKEPIATKRSCDLFDGVRKDAMTLLILQKMALKKETELAEKKAKLERRTSRATANTTAQEKKDETQKAADPKGSKPAEKTKESSQNGGAGATTEKSSKKKDSQNGGAGATTEKASKKKRKNPTPATISATVVAPPVPIASQPGSTTAVPAASADPHKPAAVTSSAPSSTTPVPPATTSSSLISQGKTTKTAGRKRVRKK